MNFRQLQYFYETANNIDTSAFLKGVAENDSFTSIPLNPPVYTKVGIVWKDGAYISNANKLFIDFLEKNKGQLV